MATMNDSTRETAQATADEPSAVDLERLRLQRRRTLDDMRRLDQEIRLQRAQDRLRMLRGARSQG